MQRDQVVNELKKYAPASLKVELRDGTDKPVSVPKAGNRWARVQQVLDSLPWVTIECLDKDGRLLKVIEDDDELEALVEEGGGGDRAMAKVLLDVMRTTMKETRGLYEAQMSGLARLVQAMADGQAAMVDSYRMALQNVQQMQVVSGGEDNKEVLQMMGMAMQLMQQQKLAAQKGG